jgi:glycyl-tRNA synthetase beta subunit
MKDLYAEYNKIFYSEDFSYAKEQLKLYEDKVKNIDKLDISEENKKIRKNRVNFLISCIKYTYSL